MLVIASVLLVAILIVLNLPGYALTVFVTLVAMALNIWVEEGNANRRKVNRYKSMEAYNRINNPKAVNRYKRVQ